jgi:xanthine/uracil/vitamin C permease (AzgA family)
VSLWAPALVRDEGAAACSIMTAAGRNAGLASIICGLCFLLALPIIPLIELVPAIATGAAAALPRACAR